MVSRFHQSNGYIKRKLRVWRSEKRNALVGAETALTCPGSQKCNAQVGAETALTCAGSQTTPFYGGEYRAEYGNMRNFGPTNSHGTAFAPKQWLHEKEAMGMESPKT